MIDHSDFNLSGSELKEKYDAQQPGDHWSEHPHFSHEDWANEVSELNTLAGYWDWVASEIDAYFLEVEEGDEEE